MGNKYLRFVNPASKKKRVKNQIHIWLKWSAITRSDRYTASTVMTDYTYLKKELLLSR